ncbi:MAG TPA: hypothetical protein PK156_40270 [Polyangium sp.]|nr:hypothetical protein [Polyangium sp.]
MKSLAALLPALCLGLFASPLACGGMAVQSYIEHAKTSNKLEPELEPPACTNGEEGKNAIIKAFRDSGPKPPGALPLATFLSLSCYRGKQVREATKAVRAEEIFKANVPVEKDILDTMIAAWNVTTDEKTRDEMNGQLLFMDHVLAFQLYAAIQSSDKPLGPDKIHPKGTYFPLEGASNEETETVRKTWCQYIAPGSLKRFFDDKLRDRNETFLMRDTEMAGLIGNQCAETDQMLTELIKLVDKNAQAEEVRMAAELKMSRGGAVTQSALTLNKDSNGYPLISHIGKDIAAQGKVDPNRTKHYLDVLTQSGHSCAFGADIKSGLEGAISVTPELEPAIGPHVKAYKGFLEKTCGSLP